MYTTRRENYLHSIFSFAPLCSPFYLLGTLLLWQDPSTSFPGCSWTTPLFPHLALVPSHPKSRPPLGFPDPNMHLIRTTLRTQPISSQTDMMGTINTIRNRLGRNIEVFPFSPSCLVDARTRSWRDLSSTWPCGWRHWSSAASVLYRSQQHLPVDLAVCNYTTSHALDTPCSVKKIVGVTKSRETPMISSLKGTVSPD